MSDTNYINVSENRRDNPQKLTTLITQDTKKNTTHKSTKMSNSKILNIAMRKHTQKTL
jgi:hypothetical protein